MIRFRRPHDGSMLSCREVATVLQAYLDDQTDEELTRRVSRHLDDCRRCGLEHTAYTQLKLALRRRIPTIDELALERLRGFATQLATVPPGPGHRAT